MALDPVVNFGKAVVSTGYSSSDTSILLSAGGGSVFPNPSTDGQFNLVWYNATDYSDPSDDPNKEIVRVTNISTDTLTIQRAQEGTSASTKNTAGKVYQVILAPTAKTITDIGSMKSNVATSPTPGHIAGVDAGGNVTDSGHVSPVGDIVGTTDTQTLTNKTLTTPVIASISNTGTLTLPTSTDTLVGRATTDTLSNKTLTKPTVNGSVPAVTADTYAATITFDMSASNIHNVTLTGNPTLAVTNVSTGQLFIIELVQDATGSRTVTWWSTIKWVGGSPPILTSTANKKDTFGLRCTGSGTYDGYIIGQNI